MRISDLVLAARAGWIDIAARWHYRRFEHHLSRIRDLRGEADRRLAAMNH